MPLPIPILRALLVWMLIMAAETVFGSLRRHLVPEQLAFVARQISIVLSVVLIFAISWAAAPWMRLRSIGQALAVGCGWAGLSVGFEFALGRLSGSSWARIVSEYDLRNGELMPVGLLLMAPTPWMVSRLRSHSEDAALAPGER